MDFNTAQNFKQKKGGFIQRTAIYFVVLFFVGTFAATKTTGVLN